MKTLLSILTAISISTATAQLSSQEPRQTQQQSARSIRNNLNAKLVDLWVENQYYTGYVDSCGNLKYLISLEEDSSSSYEVYNIDSVLSADGNKVTVLKHHQYRLITKNNNVDFAEEYKNDRYVLVNPIPILVRLFGDR